MAMPKNLLSYLYRLNALQYFIIHSKYIVILRLFAYKTMQGLCKILKWNLLSYEWYFNMRNHFFMPHYYYYTFCIALIGYLLYKLVHLYTVNIPVQNTFDPET